MLKLKSLVLRYGYGAKINKKSSFWLERTLVTTPRFGNSVLRSSSWTWMGLGLGLGLGNVNVNGTVTGNSAAWSLNQRRGVKVAGSEVRTGNIVQRKGIRYLVAPNLCYFPLSHFLTTSASAFLSSSIRPHIPGYQSSTHSAWQGRGLHSGSFCPSAYTVELRDVDSGNKVTERFRTDETLERVYVEEKTFQYLYSEGDMVVLTDPETFEQLEVPTELFGKNAVYLKEDMTVRVQYYDGRPMSTTVPYRVTCTVVEAQAPMKGLSVNPQYKKVLLDNGLTVLAPPFILSGDAIVINTADDSYITRAK